MPHTSHFEVACSLGKVCVDGLAEYVGHDHVMHIVGRPTHDFLAALKSRIRAVHPRLRAFRLCRYRENQLVAVTRI